MSAAQLSTTSATLVDLTILTYGMAALLFAWGLARREAWAEKAGVLLTGIGLATNAGTALTRGLATDRVPWGNMYEYSVMVGIVLAGGFLLLARRPELRPLGLFVLVTAFAFVAVGRFRLYAEPGPLVPALQSSWLRIHVLGVILGSSTLTLASLFSVLFLLKDRAERRAAPRPPLVAGGARTVDEAKVRDTLAGYGAQAAAPAAVRPVRGKGLWDRLPSARTLDELAYRTTTVGFPLWTFGVIAGAIWAQSAWGRYWGWDPKETWSFITWVVYAAYLHARATAGWRFGKAAWISVIGLATLLVNFYLVNTVLVGLHSYAGV
jgi:cytochrome c-type biogenesis protein CcsB